MVNTGRDSRCHIRVSHRGHTAVTADCFLSHDGAVFLTVREGSKVLPSGQKAANHRTAFCHLHLYPNLLTRLFSENVTQLFVSVTHQLSSRR